MRVGELNSQSLFTLLLPSINLYLVSGMAASEELFSELPRCSCFQLRYIKWVPVSKNESIESYALKLAEQIDQSKPFVIGGVSFGGIVAMEIARHLKPEMVILISSVKNGNEIPSYYRFPGTGLSLSLMKPFMGLNRFIPASLLGFLFGVRDPILAKILKRMVIKADPYLLLWSLRTLSGWAGTVGVDKLVHIHGTADRLFPIRYVKPDLAVDAAGHLLVYTHGEIVMQFIHSAIERDCGLG